MKFVRCKIHFPRHRQQTYTSIILILKRVSFPLIQRDKPDNNFFGRPAAPQSGVSRSGPRWWSGGGAHVRGFGAGDWCRHVLPPGPHWLLREFLYARNRFQRSRAYYVKAWSLRESVIDFGVPFHRSYQPILTKFGMWLRLPFNRKDQVSDLA